MVRTKQIRIKTVDYESLRREFARGMFSDPEMFSTILRERELLKSSLRKKKNFWK